MTTYQSSETSNDVRSDVQIMRVVVGLLGMVEAIRRDITFSDLSAGMRAVEKVGRPVADHRPLFRRQDEYRFVHTACLDSLCRTGVAAKIAVVVAPLVATSSRDRATKAFLPGIVMDKADELLFATDAQLEKIHPHWATMNGFTRTTHLPDLAALSVNVKAFRSRVSTAAGVDGGAACRYLKAALPYAKEPLTQLATWRERLSAIDGPVRRPRIVLPRYLPQAVREPVIKIQERSQEAATLALGLINTVLDEIERDLLPSIAEIYLSEAALTSPVSVQRFHELSQADKGRFLDDLGQRLKTAPLDPHLNSQLIVDQALESLALYGVSRNLAQGHDGPDLSAA